jgi:ABC-type transporter Mla MlaB component
VFDDPECYHARAVEFFADGIDLGLRVAYYGDGPVEQLVSHLQALEGLDDLLAREVLQIGLLGDTYGWDGLADPEVIFARFAAATKEALAAGFGGLRATADATSLVRTAAQRDVFARHECRIDRYMARNPLSALCAFRRDELGDDVAAELACLHPLTRPGTSPYQLFATGPGAAGAGISLCGELDLQTVDLLVRTLERTGGPVPGHSWEIDATDLGFIDYRNLVALEDFARQRDTVIVLRTVAGTPARLAAILQLNNVQVEVLT